MSKYTTEIRYLVESNFDFKLNTYPIFDEGYRNTLNQKIINHYYFREIGFETAGRFRFELNTVMNEIMPYYNELYKAQLDLLTKNLYNNVNLTETQSKNQENNIESNSNSNSSSNAENKNLFQDTPQGKIYEQNLTDGMYATNYTNNLNNINNLVNDTSTGNSTSTEDYVKTVIGSNGNKYSIEIFKQITNNLLNIDMEIIEKLNELFMGLY